MQTLVTRVISYGAVGGLNTLVGFGLITLQVEVFSSNVYTANFVGYACAISLSYVLNRVWTFRTTDDSWAMRFRFGFVLLIAYAVQVGVLSILLHLSVHYLVATAFGMVVYAGIGFIGSNNFVFSSGRSETL